MPPESRLTLRCRDDARGTLPDTHAARAPNADRVFDRRTSRAWAAGSTAAFAWAIGDWAFWGITGQPDQALQASRCGGLAHKSALAGVSRGEAHADRFPF